MNDGNLYPQSPGISVFPFALGVGAVVFFALLLLVGLFVIIVVANRAEPDPSGRRPVSVYLFGVSFISVFAALLGSFAIVMGLVQLIGSHPGGSSMALHPVGDAVARVVVLSGLIVLVSVGLLLTHLRRGLSLPEWAGATKTGPVARVVLSYVAGVSFISVLIAAGSIVFVIWEVFRILGPGVFGLSSPRVAAARALIAALYLAVAAATLALVHLRMLPSDLLGRIGSAGPAPSGPGGVAPGAPPPPAL